MSRETCSLFILQYIVFPWNLYNHYNKFHSYSNKRSFTFFGGSSGGHSKRIWRVREEWRAGWSEGGLVIAGDDDIEDRWPGGLILQPLVDGKSDKWSCASGSQPSFKKGGHWLWWLEDLVHKSSQIVCSGVYMYRRVKREGEMHESGETDIIRRK